MRLILSYNTGFYGKYIFGSYNLETGFYGKYCVLAHVCFGFWTFPFNHKRVANIST